MNYAIIAQGGNMWEEVRYGGTVAVNYWIVGKKKKRKEKEKEKPPVPAVRAISGDFFFSLLVLSFFFFLSFFCFLQCGFTCKCLVIYSVSFILSKLQPQRVAVSHLLLLLYLLDWYTVIRYRRMFRPEERKEGGRCSFIYDILIDRGRLFQFSVDFMSHLCSVGKPTACTIWHA